MKPTVPHLTAKPLQLLSTCWFNLHFAVPALQFAIDCRSDCKLQSRNCKPQIDLKTVRLIAGRSGSRYSKVAAGRIARRIALIDWTPMPADSNASATIADRAAALVTSGMVVGLGTGKAASAFIEALGRKVQSGLAIRGVPTSESSAQLASRLGIPLTTLNDVAELDLTVDGADEVDPQGNLIKGYGGALVREKIVAAASRQLVILVGDEKLVPQLGSRGKLPVEVVQFGLAATTRHLAALGLRPQLRKTGSQPLVTDNGNYIVDCGTGPIGQPTELERAILAIPGVVGTGLFIGMAGMVLVQRSATVEVRDFPRATAH
jgi:ribose 5-phosphate isomerase A